MQKLQIKTVELLITKIMQKADDDLLRTAFCKMSEHFSDEEYLYGIGHSAIITNIYVKRVYRYKTVRKFSEDVHLDQKTLLEYRKDYLQLFAKYYLKTAASTCVDLSQFYAQLKQNKTTA